MSQATATHDSHEQFPIFLLAVGYATSACAAIILLAAGNGLLTAGLTFWLGGAFATLAWGLGIATNMVQLRPGPG